MASEESIDLRSEATSGEEIRRLCVDYCRGADLRDLDLFLSVWSEDAVWQVSPDLVFTGRHQIADAIKRQWRNLESASHRLSEPWIVVGAAFAKGRWRVDADVCTSDGQRFTIVGRYDDQYVMGLDGWRIRARVATVLDQHSEEPYRDDT